MSRALAANPSGVHLLTAHRPIRELVRAAEVGPGDLVIDFGAGPGTITAPLAATGARVLAVERDARFAARLRARFGDRPVRVVHADLRQVPLPRRPFSVVASIPFAVSTALMRRRLDGSGVPLRGADLVVEWGFARRVTAARPAQLEVAWWAARYELTLYRRIPAGCFTPAPSVDAAHLRIRPLPRLGAGGQRLLRELLTAAHARPSVRARRLLDGAQAVAVLGAHADAKAGAVPPATWAAAVRALVRRR